MHCNNPILAHQSFRVLHTNGIHDVAVDYCGCAREIPHHLQLMRRGFYPASQKIVKTCGTFRLLDLLHMLAVVSKGSMYDFYRTLEKLTNNTGIDIPKSRYRALIRICLQWRHLKMLRRGGRGHSMTGIEGTNWGELAVECPSCTHPKKNMPEDWKTRAPELA
jgi:hypothetical protein